MLCAISLDRFVAIVLATKYQKLLTKKRGYVIIGLIWLTAFVLSMPPLIGWSTYQYHPGTLHCSPVWIGQCSYFYFTFTISVMIPTSMTVISYIVIFWKVRRHRKRVSMWKHAGAREGTSKVDGNESGFEMSQIVTMNKSPAVTRRGSKVIDSQNIGSKLGMNGNSPALSHTSMSPLLDAPITKPRSISKGSYESQLAVHQTPQQKERRFKFESRDIFYDPKTSKSPKLVPKFGEPMLVSEFRDCEGRESSPEIRESSMNIANETVQSENETKPEKKDNEGSLDKRKLVSTDRNGKETGGKEGVISDEAENKASQKKRSKKSSIGRFLSLSRAKKDEPTKLSEAVASELLNVSDGNLRSSVISTSETASKTGKSESTSRENTDKDGTDSQSRKSPEKNDDKKEGKAKNNKISTITMSFVTSVVGTKNAKKSRKRASRRTSKLKRANRTLREFQVAKTGAILLAVFMVCYGPYTVVHLCHLPFPVPQWAQHLAMWCVFLNSILTPVVYGLMNKDTRTKIKMVMKKCWTSP